MLILPKIIGIVYDAVPAIAAKITASQILSAIIVLILT